MVSLWWVAAAFVAGSYAGALLFAVMTMARHEADRTSQPIAPCRASLAGTATARGIRRVRT